MSSRSASRNSRLCSSISASFRFTRQNLYSIGQAGLLDGRFAKLASKSAGEQTGQNKASQNLYLFPAILFAFVIAVFFLYTKPIAAAVRGLRASTVTAVANSRMIFIYMKLPVPLPKGNLIQDRWDGLRTVSMLCAGFFGYILAIYILAFRRLTLTCNCIRGSWVLIKASRSRG